MSNILKFYKPILIIQNDFQAFISCNIFSDIKNKNRQNL